MPQSPSMSTGWKRTPSGVGTWQSAHSSALAEAVARRQPPRPSAPTPPVAIEVQRVREFEVAHLERAAVERDALQLRPLAVPAGSAPPAGIRDGRCSKSEALASRVSGSRARCRCGNRRRIAAASAGCAAAPHARYGNRRSGPGSWPKNAPIDCWQAPEAAEIAAWRAASGARSAWSWMLVWQDVQAASRTETNGWTWQAWQLSRERRHGPATGCPRATAGRHDSPGRSAPPRSRFW